MDLAGVGEQPARRRLEHQPHGRRDRAQSAQIRPVEHAGVEVRQQPRLLQDRDRAGPQVGHGVVIARRGEPFRGRRPSVLGGVSEREQRLRACCRRTCPGDVEHLGRCEVLLLPGAAQRSGIRGERAVVTAVAAQPGQRDEDFGRIRDDAWPPCRQQSRIPDPPGDRQESVQLLAAGAQQGHGLTGIDRGASVDASDRPLDLPFTDRHGSTVRGPAQSACRSPVTIGTCR